MSRLVSMLMLAGLLLASGCEQQSADRTPAKVTSENVRRDAGQAVTTAAEFSQQAKEEFEKTLETRLKELDAEIAKLREKSGDLKADAKANWEKKMAELEAKQEAALARLGELRQSSAEGWKDIQQRAQSAWDELDQAFHDAVREF